jgi:Pathogenicity locus
MERRLKDLRGIGTKMLGDFDKLGIRSVNELKSRDAQKLYDRICKLTGTRQDPCVLDTYRCAIEQARHPDLPIEQRNWWYWSRVRKQSIV